MPPPLTAVKRKKNQSWSQEEDEKLAEAVEKYGAENWILVAQYVGGGRTRSQCSQRWLRVINPKLRKWSWTEEEDALLLKAVQEVGSTNWAKVAAIVVHRCDVQCRYRYQQLMKKAMQPKYHSMPTNKEMERMKQNRQVMVPVQYPGPRFVEEPPKRVPVDMQASKQKIPSIWNIIGNEFKV